ncbi:MAG: PP2C family serine/threonine-protein phosphatase [Ruegeria sp.]
MFPSGELFYDVTSALSRGARAHQEDAVVADFPVGADLGFVVLADGMGGHAAGDVASKIVVTEVFSELKMRSDDRERLVGNLPGILREAALSANECVRFHTEHNPETEGMGTTLLAPVLLKDSLYWISVGDSPLYLFRDGTLIRLNEDHSMAPQIEYMVRTGEMDFETGENHPDRNCLTSVLIGDDIAQIDCPAQPVRMLEGDILIAASDGVQFLSDEQIADVLEPLADSSSGEICAGMMAALEALDDPDQDNISLCVVRVTADQRLTPSAAPVARTLTRDPEQSGEGVAFMARATSSGKVVAYRVSMEKSA